MAAAYLASATGTLIDVVVDMDPAYGYLGLDVPVTAEEPGVAITDAGPGAPALIAVVAELGEVDAEDVACESDMSYVVFTPYCMDGEEVTGRGLAEPVAGFGLDEPVFPAALVGDIPCVEVA